MRNAFAPRRGFYKCESRVFCSCELCRLRFGRLLYARVSGEALGYGRIPGFDGNFGNVSLCVPSRNRYDVGRLWSLWDMLEFRASEFHQVNVFLGTLSGVLSARSAERDYVIPVGEKETFVRVLESLKEQLDIIGAKVSALAAVDAAQLAGQEWSRWGDVVDATREVNNTIKRELTTIKVFVIEADKNKYYANGNPLFGGDVHSKFGTAAYEIDEAGKCLALGRSTACVFHLMRVMEIGIQTAARCLGIPDPTRPTDRNWGNILRAIKADLDLRGGQLPTKNWTAASDKEFFESAYASLDAVRVAWRNPTMHVENKYTDDEAEHVFGAVRGFTVKLASRCDEKGDPKA